jgi:hypothetical protein
MKIPFLNSENVPKEETKPFAPYEEIQEKKTTKLGYVLLFIMVILGVWQGQGFISSLARNINDPERISECSQYLLGLVEANSYLAYGYNSYSYSAPYYYGGSGGTLSECKYSAIEQKYSIQSIVAQINSPYIRIQSLQKEVNSLQSDVYSLQNSIARGNQSYSISLQEKAVRENSVVYDKSEIKTELVSSQEQLALVQKQINDKQAEIEANTSRIRAIAFEHSTDIKAVFSDYRKEQNKVEFERALLLLLLIGPILFLTTRKYFKQKKENSQYSIIWAAVSTIFALLFAQVFFGFIYQILPHELLEKLFILFAQFAFLVTLGQYFLLLLTPMLFGGIVYWIQKKVYNKKAVMIRACLLFVLRIVSRAF